MIMEELFTRGIMMMGPSPVFTGHITMIGVDCEWRLTWTKTNDDRFAYRNEELLAGGHWGFVDEWEFQRKSA